MRILSRYFVSGYLRLYAGIVAVSMLVIAMIEMMVNLDHAIEFGEGVGGLASYLFLRLPSYYLPFLIPVGSFGAAFLCLGLPARSLEILAARASGISPRRLVAPVLACAALLSGLALLVNETIVLDSARRFNRVDGDSGSEIFQSSGSFWYQRGATLFRVEGADRETRTLRGVTIYERDAEGRLRRSIQAASARIGDDRRWHLEDAIFRDFSDGPEAAPRVEQRPSAWVELGSASDLALLEADARSLSLFGLGRYIDAIEREGRDGARFRGMWHARIADPLTVIVFALLGAPIGMAVERSRSLAVAALQGVAWVGAYYGLQTSLTILGGGPTLASVAPWALLAAFAGFGAWRLARC